MHCKTDSLIGSTNWQISHRKQVFKILWKLKQINRFFFCCSNRITSFLSLFVSLSLFFSLCYFLLRTRENRALNIRLCPSQNAFLSVKKRNAHIKTVFDMPCVAFDSLSFQFHFVCFISSYQKYFITKKKNTK